MADPDLSRLTPEERQLLDSLLSKMDPAGAADPPHEEANPGAGPERPPEDVARELAGPPAPGVREFGEYPRPGQATISRLIDAGSWVEKQLRGISSVGRENYIAGVRHPKADPIAEGIKAQGRYETKMKDPAVLKRREDQLRKTNINEWVTIAETLGADTLVDGVVKRRPKVERKIAALRAALGTHLAKIDAMASDTDAQREAKVIANLKGLRELKGKI